MFIQIIILFIHLKYKRIQKCFLRIHIFPAIMNTQKSQPYSGLATVGAVDEIRTRDIHLGKVALYH